MANGAAVGKVFTSRINYFVKNLISANGYHTFDEKDKDGNIIEGTHIAETIYDMNPIDETIYIRTKISLKEKP